MGKQKRNKHPEVVVNGKLSKKQMPDEWSWEKVGRYAVIVFLTFFFTAAHWKHITKMFESDRHFSHLSSLEREMTFRTEMGLYYSYYKTIIDAPSFSNGLHQVMHDNVTEYPDTINTLKRFNLYPEVIIGALFRAYSGFADQFGIVTKECWRTDRGKDLPPITSCEGMGDPFYFYVNTAFSLASTLAGTLFLYGLLLSGSIFGGLISVAAFFFNHGEATRVQWTPPLRETFGYPIFAIELLIVSYIVKNRLSGFRWSAIIAMFTVGFMLPWQFAQFALSTQVGSLFVAFMLNYVTTDTLRTITLGHLAGFCTAFCFLFGNEMLLTSLFLSSLITTQIVCALKPIILKLRLSFLIWIVEAGLFAAGTLGLKFYIGYLFDIHDDAHIFDILKAKFTNYSNFHTRLYTCAVEFDFLELSTLWKLVYTLLLPCAAIGLLACILQVLCQEFPHLIWAATPTDGNDTGCHKPYAELVYNSIQLGAFSVMAGIIMRLKLFWTPHLCIISSVLANHDLAFSLSFGKLRPLWQKAICVGLIASMAYEGMNNINQQRSIMGEYSNPQQEELFQWIMDNTEPRKCFDVMASFENQLPPAWNRELLKHCKLAIPAKFYQHPELRDSLLRTGSAYIVFSSIHDNFLGSGVPMNPADCTNVEKFPGKNWLGKILMKVMEQMDKPAKPPSETLPLAPVSEETIF